MRVFSKEVAEVEFARRLARPRQIVGARKAQEAGSGILPKEVWNGSLFAYLDLETLMVLERTSRFFHERLSALAPHCDCREGMHRSPHCRSVWAVTAKKVNFAHPKVGSDLACYIVKWLLAKDIRHCELCKSKFVIREEVSSWTEVAQNIAS